MTIKPGEKYRDFLLRKAYQLADNPTKSLAFLAAVDLVVDAVREERDAGSRPRDAAQA